MKKQETPDSPLRKYRMQKFETMEAFCEAFEKKHKEKLPIGTLSCYEKGGGISSRRLDLIAEVLELSNYKKKKVKEMWSNELQHRELYKEHKTRKIRSKKTAKGKVATISIQPKQTKRVANTAPSVRKETNKNKSLIKQLRTNIATRKREIAKRKKEIEVYEKEVKTYKEVIVILSR